ncbi:MAG: alkaline phosphatase family protein [Pseudomonadota bacterium]
MTQTLFIGMDGATFTVLDQLTNDPYGEGVVMPFMARVMREGYHSKLLSTPHPLTPPAWVSLVTGRSPGHHGVYDFVRFEDRKDEMFFTLYDSRDIRVETIWSLASRQDRSITSLNFPMMAPIIPVRGNLVPGFVSWKHLKSNVTPPDLYDRMKAIPGFNAKELAWDFEREGQIGEEMSQKELEDWVTGHLPREEQWFRIAETLLSEDSSDLFAVMFDGTDKLQHQVWHVLDPRRIEAGLTEEEQHLRVMVLEYFRRLDSYVARLVEVAGPDTQVFFASDHGFTGSEYVFRVNHYLGELGYLTWREHEGTEADIRREAANFADLDWEKTKAFCPTPSSNGIVIRLAEEPGDPGVPIEDYYDFRQKLIDDLMAFEHPEGGRPFIKDILLREEVFPGAARADAPDLTLILDDHGFVSVKNKAPTMVKRPTMIGTHHPDGIFLATGPGVAHKDGGTQSIIDIAAMLVHSVGLPIPEDFEARVPEGLFTDDWLRENPVKLGETTISPTELGGPVGEISEHDKERILEQLRNLGYLED